ENVIKPPTAFDSILHSNIDMKPTL
ncbi:hypothetical protein A5797_001652, partial [Enterococcus faecalis]